MSHLEPTVIDAHQATKMICKVKFLKPPIETSSFLEEIITCRNDVLKVIVSDIVVGIWKLGNLTWETDKSHNIVK